MTMNKDLYNEHIPFIGGKLTKWINAEQELKREIINSIYKVMNDLGEDAWVNIKDTDNDGVRYYAIRVGNDWEGEREVFVEAYIYDTDENESYLLACIFDTQTLIDLWEALGNALEEKSKI